MQIESIEQDVGLFVTQRCGSCSKEYNLKNRVNNCECGNGLEFRVDFNGNFQKVLVDDKSMWRYRNFMPVSFENIVSAGEGMTPIVHFKNLSKKYGIELFGKLESENPTGTFKDREGSFVVSRSLDTGENNIVMQSTGNTGISITYYSGLAGIKSYLFLFNFNTE